VCWKCEDGKGKASLKPADANAPVSKIDPERMKLDSARAKAEMC